MTTGRKQSRQKKELTEQYANELFEIIRKIAGDRGLLKEFFLDILTPAEYKELGLRWQIVKRLGKEESQRKIAKDLGVSVATITRGSRELLDKEGGFQKVLDRL